MPHCFVLLVLLPMLVQRPEEVCTMNGEKVPNINYVRDGEIRCRDSKTGKLLKVMVLKDKLARFSIYFAPNGQVTHLDAREKEFVPKDFLKLCGYDGLSEITLLDEESGKSRKETYRNGRVENERTRAEERRRAEAAAALDDEKPVPPQARTQTSTYPNGKIRKEVQYFGAFYHGSTKEYHESGKLMRHAQYEHGSFRGETCWYLNGRVKSETTVKPDDELALVQRKEFYDNGKLQSETHYRVNAFNLRGQGSLYYLPVGTSRHYDEEGGLVEERSYADKGRVSARKTYDGKGKLLKAEEYYEDGSRK